jgi:hypothetical protein
MGKSLSPEQKQTWIEKIQRQQKSGLTIEKWCTENEISSHVFHYWKKRLFPCVIDRNSFSELTDQKACLLNINYQDVHVHIKAPSLKQCLSVLKELKC